MEANSITLLSCLKDATALLKEVGIPTADLDARLLLEEVLQKDKAFCVLNPGYMLTSKEQQAFNTLIERRLTREPVAKILGHKEFWSLSFKTTQDTLDPRPDSETLIEAVLETYPDQQAPLKILDLGTGTGCLILTLLKEYPQATGLAVDISAEALDVARYNAAILSLADRIDFFQTSWTKDLMGTFDVIISNPPYIPVSHAERLAPELAFDPEGALYGGGDDGLEAYRLLAPPLSKHLSPEGKVFLEFGQGQEEDIQQIFESEGFKGCALYQDLSKIIRCLSLSKA